MGTAGGGAPPPGDGGVRDALRVELGAGGDHCGLADALLASVCGAEDEQGVHGGGVRGWRGDGGVAAGPGHGGGGRGQGKACDGVRERGAAQGTGDGTQRGCRHGVEGWWIVSRGVWQVLGGRSRWPWG